MRTKNYLWAVLTMATLSLSACGSDENEEPKLPQGQAKLELTLKGTAMTKATGAALPTSEDNISRIAVAIFNSDGTVNVIQEFAVANINDPVTVNCLQGTECTGLVVANAPTGTFAGVATKTDFIGKTVDLSQIQASGNANVQDAENLPMSGEIMVSNSNTFTIGAATVTASAEVSRLVARVAITNIKTAFDPNGQYSAATFKIKKIFLHNAASQSTVGIGTPTTSTPVTGQTTGTNNYLQDVVSPDLDITSNACTTPYWFYTFATPAGGVNSTPTKLVVFGEFDADGTGTAATDVYYPIVVNKLQTGTTINDGSSNISSAGSGKGDMTIARNTRYNLTATIKGKGVANPNMNIDPATISPTVTVANWALTISQDVTFN
ncbi:MAG: fimbrial protein [Bacteroides sp.]|nr:fimbrial protein [Bacteroides sp.]